jgi:hypothetical protein
MFAKNWKKFMSLPGRYKEYKKYLCSRIQTVLSNQKRYALRRDGLWSSIYTLT